MLVRAFQLIRDCWWWCGSTVCTPSLTAVHQQLNIPMIHPRDCPLIGQPGLLTVLSLVSSTCLVLVPGESGSAAASLAASVRFPVSDLGWAGLAAAAAAAPWIPQTPSRTNIFPNSEEFASITFLCSEIYGQNSKIRYKVII